ncbi:M23 family metallopeptidase [Streptomyces argyrophylli]|uniref:Peptidoglycan DD-metalloendopeptidase family protein n=1 Tax=Streptomyces argyrophylli TaxID=2726118 RepID=A0A6M4PJZ6_9ACTN|nr:M23 family metallopeptidase [Streptomyces argyrophyllae]QJS10413.1 peptidoglycan DD-metalloendopeptidase family protein [Streptomyces argyrophyllae]
MNDRHPSGTMTTPAPASDASTAHYAPYGAQEAPYDDLTTYGGYDATHFPGDPGSTSAFHTDPLFGSLPGSEQTTGAYDTTHWQTGSAQTPAYDPYAAQHYAAYDSGAYDGTAWAIPGQPTGNDVSGQWDAGAWTQPGPSGGADPTQQWEWGTQTFDTGAYDATQWNVAGQSVPAQSEPGDEPFDQQATATFEAVGGPPSAFEHTGDPQASAAFEQVPYEDTDFDEQPAADGESDSTGELPAATGLLDGQEEVAPGPATRAGSRGAARSRRRTPAKRSRLLTVAVPSACVMGVAGIAAASVGALADDSHDTATTASDAQPVKPSVANSKLDSQLKTLSAGADDFADRASRTQERIDLKAQQELEKKKAAAEAALKERLRPKFALPVTQHGLSAYFGQAGINWMSVHTGIDFPVSYGTTVMAATDGTVTTKWNSAYGNMMIVTAKDGTETWYCHLSSYSVASGTTVKAGQPIGHSGNSGNSTGPHLHFEVRPAGGSAIDPLPWLRSHGLNPT